MGVLYAWHLSARPPGRPVPVVQVHERDGTVVAERQAPSSPGGPLGWDRTLGQLGYTRISRWREMNTINGRSPSHVCAVAPAHSVPATGSGGGAHPDAGMLPSCSSSTVLRSEHAAQLRRWEFGASSGDVIDCEYAAGHVPPHIGLGQEGDDDRWRWLMWIDDDVRLITIARLCGVEGQPAVYGPASDLYPCALPLGHAPGHSWQLERFHPADESVSDLPPGAPHRGILFPPED